MADRSTIDFEFAGPFSGTTSMQAPRSVAASRRAEIAVLAMQGILAGGFADTVPHDDVDAPRTVAAFALAYADALIAALALALAAQEKQND